MIVSKEVLHKLQGNMGSLARCFSWRREKGMQVKTLFQRQWPSTLCSWELLFLPGNGEPGYTILTKQLPGALVHCIPEQREKGAMIWGVCSTSSRPREGCVRGGGNVQVWRQGFLMPAAVKCKTKKRYFWGLQCCDLPNSLPVYTFTSIQVINFDL